MWQSIMMRCRRKLTWRSVCFGAAAILLFMMIFLYRRVPSNVTSNLATEPLEPLIIDSNRPFDSSREEVSHSAILRPCKVYRLHPDKQATESNRSQAQCKRVQPVPGSCDVAQRLFHSTPTASCDTKTYPPVELCSIIGTPQGPKAHCPENKCSPKFTLTAATVDVHSGATNWIEFDSNETALEEWINGLLQPSPSKKHFGFCYVDCQYLTTDEESDDDEFGLESKLGGEPQLLLLPPSVPEPTDRKPSGHNININIVFVDSVSRQHFFRSMPETVKLFREMSASDKNSGDVSLFDFELVQSVRSRTFETLQVLFSGKIDPSEKPFGTMEMPPEPLEIQGLLKGLKERGYSTLWLEDLCVDWEWGLVKDLLVHNRSLTARQRWVKLQRALATAHIDSLDITYAMCRVLEQNGVHDHFHGPDAVCYNGVQQHDLLLSYVLNYQKTLSAAGTPFLTFTETNIAHEDTGRRVQALDASLRRYLQKAVKLDHTLTVLMSDHGNAYGSFLEESEEGRVELFHPMLFFILPPKVKAVLGSDAMAALRTNQRRLVSHLDLHYTLQSLAAGQSKVVSVSPNHAAYNLTAGGLLEPVSTGRSCNHIPRIMPNLCICDNYDVPVKSDDYHALFAHFAVGKVNNAIQRQFEEIAGQPRGKPRRGFGRCRQLRLATFNKVRRSVLEGSIYLKMDLVMPQNDPDPDPDLRQGGWSASQEEQMEIFFVAMHMRPSGVDRSGSNIIVQTVDRITPYSKFSVCADTTVKLQLCVCDIKGSDPRDKRPPTADQLERSSLLSSQVIVAEKSHDCVLLLVHKNEHGGVFSLANVCQGKAFQVLFDMVTERMVVSDPMPRRETVYPGQTITLAMAVKDAPRAKWSWSFTLHHTSLAL